jgi:hypothetical protein
VYSKLNQLRQHPLYKNNFYSDRVIHSFNGPFKWLQLTTDTSNIIVLGNFDVAASQATITFPNAGTWYDYLSGSTFTATGSGQSILLQPGEYRVYVNRNITNSGGGGGGGTPISSLVVKLLPNLITRTTSGTGAVDLYLEMPAVGLVQATLYNSGGQNLGLLYSGQLNSGIQRIALQQKLQSLPAGNFFIRCVVAGSTKTLRFVIH